MNFGVLLPLLARGLSELERPPSALAKWGLVAAATVAGATQETVLAKKAKAYLFMRVIPGKLIAVLGLCHR